VRQQTKLIYERYDLRGVDVSRQQTELQDLLRMDRQREFVLAKAPLFRLLVIRLGEQSYEIVLSHHPVLLDRRSRSLMLDEVLALYRAELQNSDGVNPAPPAFRDYVTWVERQDLAGAELYWRNRFVHLPEFLSKTVSRNVIFTNTEFASLRTFAERSCVSLETLMIAAAALVLMRERNTSEVSIGVVAQQRPQGLPESEQMIGLLESVLPLPIAFTGEQSLESWLQQIESERTRIDRYAHLSQSQIKQWIGATTDREPLFDSVVLVTEPAKSQSVAGVTIDQGTDFYVELQTERTDYTDNLRDALKSLTFPALYLSPTTTSTPARVELQGEAEHPIDFSLFYFADDNAVYGEDKYRLYREGALFADRHELTAVWTPERHFHEKAGLYPNPSVLSGALATITKHIKLRAGSVVLPLHNSLRAAEEWSVVDNLSNGRVGISFTSGWMPNDFAFFPDRYPNKRDEMFRGIAEVQRLWRGESIPGRDGLGKEIEVRIFPKPIQAELPIWLTCSGGPEMFEKAGELGFHCLTALLTQSIEEVAPKIKLYRDALVRHGHDPRSGKVTMMMHTFIGEDAEAVLQKVRVPLTKYLKSHLSLIETGAQSLNLELDVREHEDPEKYRDQLAEFAFQRYYRTASLIGTPTSCMKMIEKLKAIGVDEVACLIDFGVDVDSVLESLDHLVVLRELSNQAQPEASLVATTAAHV
jgi:natural product biosynthesis luciferase-like monooxygenase protein